MSWGSSHLSSTQSQENYTGWTWTGIKAYRPSEYLKWVYSDTIFLMLFNFSISILVFWLAKGVFLPKATVLTMEILRNMYSFVY